MNTMPYAICIRQTGGQSAALIVSMLVLGFAQSGLCMAANQWHDAIPSVTVSYADLDLSKPQGATTLFHRLEEAAETVCARSHELVTTFHEIRMQECEHRIIKGAVVKIGRPSLYAVYDAKYHEVLPNQAPQLAAIRSAKRSCSSVSCCARCSSPTTPSRDRSGASCCGYSTAASPSMP